MNPKFWCIITVGQFQTATWILDDHLKEDGNKLARKFTSVTLFKSKFSKAGGKIQDHDS